MDKIIGFKIVSAYINWVALSGTKQSPQYLNHNRITFPEGEKPSEIANWAETVFENLLDLEKPCEVTYKLTANLSNHSQIFRIYYCLGILNLVAYKRGIITTHITPQSLKTKTSKEVSISQHVLSVLGNHGTYWRGDMLEAAAAALLRLPK